MSGLNLQYLQAAPVDPESRLPSTLEPSSSNIAYDFGSSRPQRVIKSMPGKPGTIDKKKTMRQGTTIYDEEELEEKAAAAARLRASGRHAAWGDEDDEYDGRRPASAKRERSDRYRSNDPHYSNSRGILSSSASAARLTASDLGAGTPGDSLVSQHPSTATPLQHPFRPQQAMYADALQTPAGVVGHESKPMHPAMFNQAIKQLREAPFVAEPTSQQSTTKPAASVTSPLKPSQSSASEAKAEIERYLDENARVGSTAQHQARRRELETEAAAGLRRLSRAEREKLKYEQRVDKLERDLAYMHLESEHQAKAEEKAAREQKKREKEAALHQSDLAASQQAALRALDVSDPIAAHQRHLDALSQALASGKILDPALKTHLKALKKQHEANLYALEDLYYAQKLTGQLGQTLIQASTQQLALLQQQQSQLNAVQAQANHLSSSNQALLRSLLPSQLNTSQTGGAAAAAFLPVDPATGQRLHAWAEGTELGAADVIYAMDQSLVRNAAQQRKGVADADPHDYEKLRLAADFHTQHPHSHHHHHPHHHHHHHHHDKAKHKHAHRDRGRAGSRSGSESDEVSSGVEDLSDDDAAADSNSRGAQYRWKAVPHDVDAELAREDKQHARELENERDRKKHSHSHSHRHSHKHAHSHKHSHSRSHSSHKHSHSHSSHKHRHTRSPSASRSRSRSHSRSASSSRPSSAHSSRSSASIRSQQTVSTTNLSTAERLEQERLLADAEADERARAHKRSSSRGRGDRRGRGSGSGTAEPHDELYDASARRSARHSDRTRPRDQSDRDVTEVLGTKRIQRMGDSLLDDSADVESSLDEPHYHPRRPPHHAERDIADALDEGVRPEDLPARSAAQEAYLARTAGAGERERGRGRPSTAAPGKRAAHSPSASRSPAAARPHSRSRSRPRSAVAVSRPGEAVARDPNVSITKQKFEEYLKELKEKEEKENHHTFKANPLPASTLEPRYTQMMQAAKARSKQQRRERRQQTEALLKPFSFAASKALQQRRRSRSRGAGTDDSQSETPASSVSPQRKRPGKRAHKDKDGADASEEGGDIGNGEGGDEDDNDDDDDASSGISYQVAFGLTTRSRSASPSKSGDASSSPVSASASASPVKPFKAKKVPWTSQVALLDGMLRTREKERKVRVAERAQMLRETAKLPPRMEMHQKKKEREEQTRVLDQHDTPASAAKLKHHSSSSSLKKKGYVDPEATFKPQLNKTIPDFKALQREFEDSLKRVKASRPLTKPVEFNLTPTLKREVSTERFEHFRANPYIPAPEPEEVPMSTKKLEQMKEKNRKLLEERERKKREEEAELAQKLKGNPEMKKTLIPTIAANHSFGTESTQDKIKQAVKEGKRALKRNDQEWQSRVAEMKERVKSRPLLIQTYNQQQGRIEARRKALIAIKESLDKAGVKDQSKFFDPQELRDLDLHWDL